MANVVQNNEGEWVLRVEWSIDDVRQYMEDSDADPSVLTDNDCVNILKIMAHNHDAEVGISWDSINFALEYYFANISSDAPMFIRGVELEVGA